jgi:hypothetical protein
MTEFKFRSYQDNILVLSIALCAVYARTTIAYPYVRKSHSPIISRKAVLKLPLLEL